MKNNMKELGWDLIKVVGDTEYYSTKKFTFESHGYEMFAIYSHLSGMTDIYFEFEDGYTSDYHSNHVCSKEHFISLIKGLV